MSEKRLAIVDVDRCKPAKCAQECQKKCPVVKLGRECVIVSKTASAATILPSCTGCGICTRVCPYKAIKVVKLPGTLSSMEIVHSYGQNSFRLFRLPQPRLGQVVGLIGINGVGKSTCMKILAGKLLPNFNQGTTKEWRDVILHYRGTALQNFFDTLTSLEESVSIKPQHVEFLGSRSLGSRTLRQILDEEKLQSRKEQLIDDLALTPLLDRELKFLSGGELQRVAIFLCCLKNHKVFLFDEPSCFLDIKQRLSVSRVIRSLSRSDSYVMVVEHDLAVLDYLSDFICCLYGEPNAYGVVSSPLPVAEGINRYLDGYIPADNMRFRDEQIVFKFTEEDERKDKDDINEKKAPSIYWSHPSFEKTLKSKDSIFKLEVEKSSFFPGEIIVILAENGLGKSTYLKSLARFKDFANPALESIPDIRWSYKPQMVTPKSKGTVLELFQSKARQALLEPFRSNVLHALGILDFQEQKVQTLSGGQLQRLAVAMTLAKPADIYFIDEPSAYLDCEQRVSVSRVIKKFVADTQTLALVVEHDFMMATYLATRMMLFEGVPGVNSQGFAPMPISKAVNRFLESVKITFRHDRETQRPRVNKPLSTKDQEQQKSKTYFAL